MKINFINGQISNLGIMSWGVTLTDNSPPWPLQIDNTPVAVGTFTPMVGAKFALVAERGLVA